MMCIYSLSLSFFFVRDGWGRIYKSPIYMLPGFPILFLEEKKGITSPSMRKEGKGGKRGEESRWNTAVAERERERERKKDKKERKKKKKKDGRERKGKKRKQKKKELDRCSLFFLF